MAFMKRLLLLFLLLILKLSLHAQSDSTAVDAAHKDFDRNASSISVSIYPVPVRENHFTVKTDRDVSFIRITNIIGQDVFRQRYNTPQQLNKITLDNPNRGMYLVTLVFSDGTRVVKKIMVEQSE